MAKNAKRGGFAATVTDAAEQAQSLLLSVDGLGVAADVPVGDAKVPECLRLRSIIVQAAGCSQREAVGGDPVLQVALGVQVEPDAPGEPPGVVVPAVCVY